MNKKTYKIKFDKLDPQAEFFDDDTTKTLLLSAGLGCIHESSLIETRDGLFHPPDINGPTHYKTFNGINLDYRLGTAPFLKGKGDLYRVIHEQGEFVAYEHHRVFCHDYKYRSLDCLRTGTIGKASASLFLPSTNLEVSPSAPFLNDPHCLSKALDSLVYCLAYNRFCDERPHEVQDNGQAFSPSLNDVLAYVRSFCFFFSEHVDDLTGLALEHSHHDQSFDRFYMMDYILHLVELVEGVEDRISSIYPGHTLRCNQQSQLSPLIFELRCLASLLNQHHIYEHLLALCTSSTKSESKILSIEKYGNDYYWDLQVPGTHNYVANGCIHHNSGKSYALVMKMLKLSMLNTGSSGGLLCPSYSDYKRDIEPLFVQILEDNKVPFHYHKTNKTYAFPWNSKPLYIFTAEKPIAGPNLSYCGINEFSLIEYERVKEMLRRVRVGGAKHLQRCLVGTPEDVHGWLQEFIEKQREQGNFKLIYGSTKDNPHLDKDYFDDLAAVLDEESMKVFTEGKIVKLGSDYWYYNFEYSKNVSDKIVEQKDLPIHVGMDFNVGRMAATLAHRINNEYHIFDEIFLTGDSDTPKMCQELLKRYNPNRLIITCDASGKARKSVGASDVQILKQHGLHNVRHRASNPRLRERQLLLNAKLAKREIMLHPKCKNSIRDLQSVQQHKTTYEKIKSKDDRLTHLSDSIDYPVEYEFNISIRRSKTIQI